MAGAGIQWRRTRTQRQALVAAYEGSSLSQRAFCAQHGIAVSTLRHWRERLVDGVVTADSASMQGARLIPVRVVEEATASSGVILVVGEGVRIEVTAGFDESTLARVLATLGAGT